QPAAGIGQVGVDRVAGGEADLPIVVGSWRAGGNRRETVATRRGWRQPLAYVGNVSGHVEPLTGIVAPDAGIAGRPGADADHGRGAGGNPDAVLVVGIDDDARNRPAGERIGRRQRVVGQQRPGLAGVGRFVDAGAVEGVPGVVGLAGGQVDRGRVAGSDGDG